MLKQKSRRKLVEAQKAKAYADIQNFLGNIIDRYKELSSPDQEDDEDDQALLQALEVLDRTRIFVK